MVLTTSPGALGMITHAAVSGNGHHVHMHGRSEKAGQSSPRPLRERDDENGSTGKSESRGMSVKTCFPGLLIIVRKRSRRCPRCLSLHTLVPAPKPSTSPLWPKKPLRIPPRGRRGPLVMRGTTFSGPAPLRPPPQSSFSTSQNLSEKEHRVKIFTS